ncbi:hypothetical protein CALCODRAFT_514954 [Calocera cornea HHB12733]|uniref:Uncharacterized protein n=1 Tax=Calocera cornea HHB12733 TaxID=1353952 RepID=A0A165IUX3_9BASI|nr:hypothetical protein CALCODRAFT_514954 [Calocera cornea HHB12733]
MLSDILPLAMTLTTATRLVEFTHAHTRTNATEDFLHRLLDSFEQAKTAGVPEELLESIWHDAEGPLRKATAGAAPSSGFFTRCIALITSKAKLERLLTKLETEVSQQKLKNSAKKLTVLNTAQPEPPAYEPGSRGRRSWSTAQGSADLVTSGSDLPVNEVPAMQEIQIAEEKAWSVWTAQSCPLLPGARGASP